MDYGYLMGSDNLLEGTATPLTVRVEERKQGNCRVMTPRSTLPEWSVLRGIAG
jgi:hypothetical protein